MKKAKKTKEKSPDALQLLETIKTIDSPLLAGLLAENRLKTFKDFIYDRQKAYCNSIKLSEAGFSYCVDGEDEPDATCQFCSKTLSFDPDDNPWEEHKKHCPKCPFVFVNQLDETKWTVENALFLIAALQANKNKTPTTKLANELTMMLEDLLGFCK